MFKKNSFDFVKNIFELDGCTLVSTEYTNSKTLLEYKCNCGNEEICKISFDNFTKGIRCSKCRQSRYEESMMAKVGVKHHCMIPESRNRMIEKIKEAKRMKFEDVKKIFEEKSCCLLQNDYNGSKEKMKVKFECGYKGLISLNHFQSGRRCNNRECIKKRKIENTAG